MTDPATPEPYYGEPPADLGHLYLPTWHEFMHYLYLPVRIPWSDAALPGGITPGGGAFERNDPWSVPPALRFLAAVAAGVADDARQVAPHLGDPYVYITARRGYATPGNPLNRPGWHCDDFGGTDLNYIWSTVYPTRFLVSDLPLEIPEDDQESMSVMSMYAEHAQAATDRWHEKQQFNGNAERPPRRIEHGSTERLLRLSPYVVHDTPEIRPPGGMRSFFKISVSTHRYDLLGNSHNHGLDYDWPLFDREALRNQPQGANSDYSGVGT